MLALAEEFLSPKCGGLCHVVHVFDEMMNFVMELISCSCVVGVFKFSALR